MFSIANEKAALFVLIRALVFKGFQKCFFVYVSNEKYMFNYYLKRIKKWFFFQLHAVSRLLLGRQRQPCVKTIGSPLFAGLVTQRRALPCYQNEERKTVVF